MAGVAVSEQGDLAVFSETGMTDLHYGKMKTTMGLSSRPMEIREEAMKKPIQYDTTLPKTNQTPFERLSAAMSTVLSVPKSSLPKPRKNTRKK
jgi:hypothetical protein